MANEFAVNSLGMLFIGFTLATWLFGANVGDLTTLQTYVYFQRYDDGFLLKVVVVIVFTVFTCWGIYMEIVQTPILPLQGNMQSTRGIYPYCPVWCHKLILTARVSQLESTAADVAIFIVQWYSTYLGQPNPVLTSSLAFWLEVYTKVHHLPPFFVLPKWFVLHSVLAKQMVDRVNSLYLAGKSLPLLNEVCFALALGLVTLTDIVITISLVGYLFDGKSSFGPTSQLLDGLILYCVQRGILTTVSHVIVVVLWFTLPTNWAWTLFQFSLGKVYTLTFITLLNRRESLKQVDHRMHEHFLPDLEMSNHVVPTTGGCENEKDEDKSESAVLSAI
ncbi:hypothetical protein EV363DRAFT_1534347 [Boletus edulis]|nr:hypothetical protein EV363DRAFT_1534347 [Boletus edulis]